MARIRPSRPPGRIPIGKCLPVLTSGPKSLPSKVRQQPQSPALGFQVVRCPGIKVALSEAAGVGISEFQVVQVPQSRDGPLITRTGRNNGRWRASRCFRWSGPQTRDGPLCGLFRIPSVLPTKRTTNCCLNQRMSQCTSCRCRLWIRPGRGDSGGRGAGRASRGERLRTATI